MGEVITLRDERQEQQKALEDFLKAIKQAQEKEMGLPVLFPSLVKELRQHFYVIPSSGKKPIRPFRTPEQKEVANQAPVSTEACLIMPLWLAIVDVDDVEEFCTHYGLNRQQIEEIATVKTGKGYHIYLFDPEGKLRRRSLRDGWELRRGENLVTVLPGSRLYHKRLQKNVTYTVLQPKVYTLEELPEWLRDLLEHTELEQTEEREEAHEGHEEHTQVAVDWDRLLQIVLDHYVEGRRQDIVFSLAGWLRKKGIPEAEIKKFVERLIQAAGDTETKKRNQAVEYTYREKEVEALLGWQGLIQAGLPPEELESCISTGWPGEGYCVRQGILYRETKNGGLEMLGPAIRITAQLVQVDTGTVQYELEYRKKRFTIDRITDTETIQRATGIAVTSEKRFKEWLNLQVAGGQLRKKYICDRTGWEQLDGRLVFLHPCLHEEHVWTGHILTTKKLAVVRHPETQKEALLSAIKDPGPLTVLFTASVASTVLDLLGQEGQSFCVLISGPSGTGKTTAAAIACSLFYDAHSAIATAFATQVGVERLRFALRGLPVVLDELGIASISPEQIVFTVGAGVAKLRGTRNLKVSFDSLQGVVFLTSEVAEQEMFRRTGAWRRMLQLRLYDRLQIDNFKALLRSCGAGIEFLRWLEDVANSDPAGVAETFVRVDELLQGLDPIWRVAKPVFVALHLLAEWLNTSPDEANQYLRDFLLAHVQEFSERVDLVGRFKEEFAAWIAENQHLLIGLNPGEVFPRHGYIGRVDEDRIYILTTKFKEFCAARGFEVRVLLKKLQDAGLFFPSGSGLRTMIRIDKSVASCYAFARSLIEAPET